MDETHTNRLPNKKQHLSKRADTVKDIVDPSLPTVRGEISNLKLHKYRNVRLESSMFIEGAGSNTMYTQ